MKDIESMQNTIESVKALPPPADPKETARFIWLCQDALNATTHKDQIGTILIGQTQDSNDSRLVFDPKKGKLMFLANIQVRALEPYANAMLTQSTKIRENFFWNPSSVQAEEGQYWHLINPNAETGKGTIQNVQQDIIDLLSSGISILQVFGFTQQAWEDALEKVSPNIYKGDPNDNKKIADIASQMAAKVAPEFPYPRPDDVLNSLCPLLNTAGMDWRLTLKLYTKKFLPDYKCKPPTVVPEIDF
jgi:hypothetical protein